MEPIIQCQQVTKKYPGQETAALRDFSIAVEPGEFLTVIGSSGCGKTTFLRLINGLLMPDSGSVFVEGQDVSKADLIALRRGIGYVIQSISLFPHMTVADNMNYVPSLSKGTGRDPKVLCDIVGLDPALLNRYPGELSGGQQQRVGIARALSAEPKILLMDEPFGAVDEITRRHLQKSFKGIQRELGVTTVFVTHDIREALLLGDRVAVMDAGRLVQWGTPDLILNHPATPFVAELVQ